MPLLQVRDLPEDLYEKLARVARAENRSIAQETIVLLREALNQKEERMAKRRDLLDAIGSQVAEGADSFPDPVSLLREDRGR
jgi:plasmid stability protein